MPPINVLIVEDNNISLKVLEGLMKKLKIRWKTAKNGQIAVEMWKTGGFHVVLMDIHMPVMDGIQATKEIRRLERVDGIGAFPKTRIEKPSSEAISAEALTGAKEAHMLEGDARLDTGHVFRSPVIIVALTASALQADRHEALAAGCNDFLTKPVGLAWLARKLKEWGCMQALIDFDSWRKWRDDTGKGTKWEQDET